MIYNFNLGVGWASSGVEYAQAYRAQVLKRLNVPAKFYFADIIRGDNIEHMTANLGLEDDQVVWLYQYFTDFHIAPCSVPIAEFETEMQDAAKKTFPEKHLIRYIFEQERRSVDLYYSRIDSEHVQRVEYFHSGFLSRIDYYSYALMFSEFYAYREEKAVCFMRRFYMEDGRVAFEELIDNKEKDKPAMYRFPDRICYSKEELAEWMIRDLAEKEWSKDDLVIMDRSTLWGQSMIRYHGPAKLISVLHADHYCEGACGEENILWNNYYEYVFSHMDHISCFIASTDAQNEVFRKQCLEYLGKAPKIVTIPVGALDELRYPGKEGRKPYSLVTASRLATEKHVDWVVKAVIRAKEKLPELSLDIYGNGSEEKTLKALIEEAGAGDYIKLMGHQDMTERYTRYTAYIAGSTSEGFGLTLMEAVGSGLGMIGLDVPYGNQTFIIDKKNGCLLPVDLKEDTPDVMTDKLTDGILRFFGKGDPERYAKVSYELASSYLAEVIDAKWNKLLEEL